MTTNINDLLLLPDLVSVRDRLLNRSIPEPNTGCWLWEGGGNRYGAIGVGPIVYAAHRLSYLLHRGAIPAGLGVLHRCDMPLCINPDHLFLGTQHENLDDMRRKRRDRPGRRKGGKNRRSAGK